MKMNSEEEAKAHRHFAASCYNATWDLIGKDRTEDENRVMRDLAHASMWHWRQREDCTAIKLAIGYWLLARVYALTGEADLARRYGALSLAETGEEDVFYRAFAYEALARAEMVAGNRAAMAENLAEAAKLAEQVAKAEEAAWLRENLGSISLAE